MSSIFQNMSTTIYMYDNEFIIPPTLGEFFTTHYAFNDLRMKANHVKNIKAKLHEHVTTLYPNGITSQEITNDVSMAPKVEFILCDGHNINIVLEIMRQYPHLTMKMISKI